MAILSFSPMCSRLCRVHGPRKSAAAGAVPAWPCHINKQCNTRRYNKWQENPW
nr:MAG TPA: hypothetical protein [Caudoviricetes sp.]